MACGHRILQTSVTNTRCPARRGLGRSRFRSTCGRRLLRLGERRSYADVSRHSSTVISDVSADDQRHNRNRLANMNEGALGSRSRHVERFVVYKLQEESGHARAAVAPRPRRQGVALIRAVTQRDRRRAQQPETKYLNAPRGRCSSASCACAAGSCGSSRRGASARYRSRPGRRPRAGSGSPKCRP